MKRFKPTEHSVYKDLDTGQELSLHGLTACGTYMIEFDKTVAFYKDVQFHREDGPAIIYYENNSKRKIIRIEYIINGHHLTESDWLQKISKENRIKYLFSFPHFIT